VRPKWETLELEAPPWSQGLGWYLELGQELGANHVGQQAKSSQVNTLPKAKSKTRSKQKKDM
jgi:hypothetical protein